ncbi:ABC transporter permease (plasmid) [Aminobacter sp. SR38]|jgi:putative spermidine/putrescine transport system permease protein|uniref:ABC transporter permease n=1 Tax=Aminobacter TaxID=31988 RepID=UPI00177C048B|nr:ABC transporter permease [Aminobacter sp. SR38]QOF74444.1 ABC transporter permease [Aminobacter sp. SR38]
MSAVEAAPRLDSRGNRGSAAWMVVPALVLLIGFFALPYLTIITMSLREASTRAVYGDGFTLAHYTTALGDFYIWGILGRTLLIGATVTVISLLLGYPVAYHLAKSRSRWTSLLYIFVLSPLLVGLVVRTFAWMIILSNNGVANQALKATGLLDFPLQLMNNSLGVTIALTHVFLPFIILPLLGNLQAISPDLAMASRSLGASRMRTFWKVTLPLSMPGIQAGTILVFVLSISAYVTPAMLGGTGGRTMSVLVVQYLVDNFRWPAGAALAIIMAAVAVIFVGLYLRLTARAMRRLP